MIARAGVAAYILLYHRLHLRGPGYLLRRLARVLPTLQHARFHVDGVGDLTLDLRDESAYAWIERQAEPGRPLEPALVHAIARVLKPGMTFWDVGASAGLISAHFSDARYGLQAVHAFEPNPVPFGMLQSALAGRANAYPHPFGLGRRDETVHLSMEPGRSMRGSVSHAAGTDTLAIALRAADSFLDEHPDAVPHVIKVDVEGHEADVLGGMDRLLKEHRPVIFFEHIFLSDETLAHAMPEQYELLFILDDGRVTADPSGRRLGHNAIYWPAERIRPW